MCREDKYDNQTSYPSDQLGYTAKYSSEIEKFIHEAAEKFGGDSGGFMGSMGGGSAVKDFARALAAIAFAATMPKYEWSFTVNFFHDLYESGANAVAGGFGGGYSHPDVPEYQSWPKPEEVGYKYYMDQEYYTNPLWFSGSTDNVSVSGTVNQNHEISARQHWCFDDDGVNLSLTLVGACEQINDHTALQWYVRNTDDATPLHISVTMCFTDGSWVHHRDMPIQTIGTRYGDRKGVEIPGIGPNLKWVLVHTVVKASVSS